MSGEDPNFMTGAEWGAGVVPALLLLVLGAASLINRPFTERVTSRLVAGAILLGLSCSSLVLAWMLLTGTRHRTVELGNWIEIGEPHGEMEGGDGETPPEAGLAAPKYHFSVKLLYDRLSIPFVLMSYLLCGTIAAFADRYLHREPGFHRFFVLLAVFLLGMVVTSLAGTIETLFAGWELVGLSSALLVAFYHERAMPVRNGLRVWSVYRVSDAALLLAAVWLHHLRGEGDFDALMGVEPWPIGDIVLTHTQCFLIGGLLLTAAAGKSALIPFSGWLPRAMEGPTPSSAIFYGALSVHLGAYLLLRISPILEEAPALAAVVVFLGLSTAVFATLAGRVQTDIKCALTFASLTQVGIIVAEIGIGLRYIALTHIIGHICLRTLQFLRAPSLLQDYRQMENALGRRLPRMASTLGFLVPAGVRRWSYRFALERGYLDAWLTEYLTLPFLRLLRACDGLERRWTDYLAGGQSRDSDRVRPGSALDELS